MSQILTQPSPGEKVVGEDGKLLPNIQAFLTDIVAKVNLRLLDSQIIMDEYTVATVPSASDGKYGWIFVTDETGGATPAYSDGTDWRRVSDRAVIS